MTYFKKKYPDKILDIELEKLTSDPKFYSKKIYDFCSFNWNEDILNYFNDKNLPIKTASFMQVRNNINTSRKKKYNSYYYLFKKLK